MSRPPRPTEAELKILKLLWELGPAPVKEVHAALARIQDYTYTGALRMLQVMFEKGLVGDLRDRLFGGSALALVQAALAGGAVPAEEKARIRELLGREEQP